MVHLVDRYLLDRSISRLLSNPLAITLESTENHNQIQNFSYVLLHYFLVFLGVPVVLNPHEISDLLWSFSTDGCDNELTSDVAGRGK